MSNFEGFKVTFVMCVVVVLGAYLFKKCVTYRTASDGRLSTEPGNPVIKNSERRTVPLMCPLSADFR